MIKQMMAMARMAAMTRPPISMGGSPSSSAGDTLRGVGVDDDDVMITNDDVMGEEVMVYEERLGL